MAQVRRAAGSDIVPLGATAPNSAERGIAIGLIVLSCLTVVLVAPFARLHLPQIAAFIPAYQAALLVIDLITAAVLYGQFAQNGWSGLLIVASAYFFDACMIVPHTLTFPGVFSPTGLLGAGPQTTAWLYLFWHGGFALFLLVYAVLRLFKGVNIRAVLGASVISILAVAALAVALTTLATLGHDRLPVIMQGSDYSLVVAKGISPGVCLIALAALAALWPQRNRSILDLWLMVVLVAWICDVLLGAVVGSARFDLGFYVGRAFGLFSSSVLLLMLLVEVVRLQAALTRSQEALGRIQHFEAIGKLSGGIAHDFNNLLTIIGGAAEMIRRSPGDESKVARLAESIRTAVQRGGATTQQLLTFARQQVSHAETVNPNHLLQRFEPLLRQAAGAHVEIRLEMSSVVDPLRVDPAQFEAAVLNLVVNARDALPSGGRVIVRTENTAISSTDELEGALPPGDFVVVEVADSGVGMTPEVAAQATNPFFTTKPFGSGSGMGLSQVYGFVKTFGGFLHIDSAPGQGTTVKMFFPKAADMPKSAVTEALPVRRALQTNESVLVVEDQAGVLALARDGLSELGYRVLTAANAEEALNLLVGDSRIDILFADIVMPGRMNGAQLAVEARRIRPGLKVLLTSGYAPETLEAQGVSGDIELLKKPYRPDELATRLRVVSG